MESRFRPFLEIGNTDFIVHMLRENVGVSLLPFFSVRRDIEKGRLAALDAEVFHMQVWRQIVYHKDKWITGEMAEFLKLAGAKPVLRAKTDVLSSALETVSETL